MDGSEVEQLQRELAESERHRELLRLLLQDMVERIDADGLIPADAWNKLTEAGRKALESQQNCLERLGTTHESPQTYGELRSLIERLQASKRHEQTRQALRWFLHLQCKAEEQGIRDQINRDLTQHREKAQALLEDTPNEAEWLAQAQPYQLFRDVYNGQYDRTDGQDPYQKIAAAFGFALSFALTGNYLAWAGPDSDNGNMPPEAEQPAEIAETAPVAAIDEPADHADPDHGEHTEYPAELCLSTPAERYSRESRPRPGTFSVNKFEKDFIEFSRLGNVAFVLVYVAKYGVLTRRMLLDTDRESTRKKGEIYLALLERLVRRGYFDAHTIETDKGEDIYFTISAHAQAIFQRSGARDMLKKMQKDNWEQRIALWDVPDDPEQAAFQLVRLRAIIDAMERMVLEGPYAEIDRSTRDLPYRLWKAKERDEHILIICGDLPAVRPWAAASDIERLVKSTVQRYDGVKALVYTTRPGGYWGERLRTAHGIAAWQVWADGDGVATDIEVKDAAIRQVLNLDGKKEPADAPHDIDTESTANTEPTEPDAHAEPAESDARPVPAELAETEKLAEPDAVEQAGRPEPAESTAQSAPSRPAESAAAAPYAEGGALEAPQALGGHPADAGPQDEHHRHEHRQHESAVLRALELLSQDRLAEGTVLLHALSRDTSVDLEGLDVLRDKVSFSLFDPLQSSRDRDRFDLLDTPIPAYVPESGTLEDMLSATVSLRMFFDPDNPNDYRLKNRWSQIHHDQSSTVLMELPSIRQLIRHYWTFVDRHGVGIKFCTSRTARNQLDVSRALEACRQEFRELIETAFPRNVKTEFNHNRVHMLATQLYQAHTGIIWQLVDRAFDMPLAELREVCRAFTLADLDGWLDEPETAAPDDGLLNEFLQRHWHEIKLERMKKEPLIGKYHMRMMSWLREAVTPLIQCCALRGYMEWSSARVPVEPEALAAARSRTLELIDDVLREMEDAAPAAGLADAAGRLCLRETLTQMRGMLDEEPKRKPEWFYAPLLLGGYVELNEKMLPVFDQEWLDAELPAYGVRLWERIVKQSHVARAEDYVQAAEKSLLRYDMGQYERLAAVLGESPVPEKKVREIGAKFPVQLKRLKEDFLMHVELAQNYGQLVSNEEMLGYIRLAEAGEQHALRTNNAGYCEWFLDELRNQIRRGSGRRMEATRQWLEALKREILQKADLGLSEEEVLAGWPILKKIERMLEERNITVAEDFIRLASNEDLKDIPLLDLWESDVYARFLDQYPLLYNACSRNKSELVRVFNQGVRNLLYPNQNNRNTENAEKFLRLWHNPKAIDDFMGMLLSQKIRDVKSAGNQREFHVYPAPRDARLAQYPHPFAAFGTEAARSGLRVILMDGPRTPSNILDEVAARGKGKGSATVVLLDAALSQADWRVLAKAVKQRNMSDEIVVVVDRVLAMFLAGFPEHDRVGAFLTVALPSSKVQPYASSGKGAIPPEMFIGRDDELKGIQKMDGPVFVYGGRQLGKTVLLQETRNREHDPKNGCYAVYIEIKHLDAKQTLAKICEELMMERVLAKPCESWEEFRSAIRERLSHGQQPIQKLMLLLDETDAFLEDCEKLKNRPLELLQELRNLLPGRFKFVLAGLRNVVRFNKRLLGENSVLGHLHGITIGPMKYLDARELLLRPLYHLGFRLEGNSESLISLILAKTNYYPGLIHFYCQKLIEAIADSYRKGVYSESTAPPYILDESHIKTLLGQKDFLAEIEERFRITLQLDTDNQYDILAKAMAYHYCERGIGQGASPGDLQEICREFGIGKIADLPLDSVQALMEEMAELNIFSPEASGSDKFVFSRYSFFQMNGDQEQLLEQLFAYGGEA